LARLALFDPPAFPDFSFAAEAEAFVDLCAVFVFAGAAVK